MCWTYVRPSHERSLSFPLFLGFDSPQLKTYQKSLINLSFYPYRKKNNLCKVHHTLIQRNICRDGRTHFVMDVQTTLMTLLTFRYTQKICTIMDVSVQNINCLFYIYT